MYEKRWFSGRIKIEHWAKMGSGLLQLFEFSIFLLLEHEHSLRLYSLINFQFKLVIYFFSIMSLNNFSHSLAV